MQADEQFRRLAELGAGQITIKNRVCVCGFCLGGGARIGVGYDWVAAESTHTASAVIH